jgi:hypothetical protein
MQRQMQQQQEGTSGEAEDHDVPEIMLVSKIVLLHTCIGTLALAHLHWHTCTHTLASTHLHWHIYTLALPHLHTHTHNFSSSRHLLVYKHYLDQHTHTHIHFHLDQLGLQQVREPLSHFLLELP